MTSEIVQLPNKTVSEDPMTGLLRTDLSTPLKTQLAASALALQAHTLDGDLTQLACDFGVSRPTVYAAADAAHRALHVHFARAEGRDSIWLRVDRAQLERAIVGLRAVAPNSIRDIEELIPIIYPGVHRSYGSIQAICAEAEHRADAHNHSVDLSPIRAAALDELFSQRQPVLAGIDLDSGFTFAVSLQAQRGAQQWGDVLRQAQDQGLDLHVVVKDAAAGIAKGVRDVFPEAEQRDDCFHAHYEMSKVARRLEQAAYRWIESEDKARRKLEALRQRGRGKATRQSLALKYAHARRRANDAIERYDAFVQAQREVEEALHFVDLERARIRRAKQMQRLLQRAGEKMTMLDSRKAQKVGRYIINRSSGLASHMTAMRKELAIISRKYGATAMRLGAVVYRLCKSLGRRNEAHKRKERREHLAVAQMMLRSVAQDKVGEILKAISAVVAKRHRASSAIEGFNAGLRPYLYVHKGVSKGYLELFRAYQNLRKRKWGRHKGRSAHEVMTGDHVEDWLTVLGYPPSVSLVH